MRKEEEFQTKLRKVYERNRTSNYKTEIRVWVPETSSDREKEFFFEDVNDAVAAAGLFDSSKIQARKVTNWKTFSIYEGEKILEGEENA